MQVIAYSEHPNSGCLRPMRSKCYTSNEVPVRCKQWENKANKICSTNKISDFPIRIRWIAVFQPLHCVEVVVVAIVATMLSLFCYMHRLCVDGVFCLGFFSVHLMTSRANLLIVHRVVSSDTSSQFKKADSRYIVTHVGLTIEHSMLSWHNSIYLPLWNGSILDINDGLNTNKYIIRRIDYNPSHLHWLWRRVEHCAWCQQNHTNYDGGDVVAFSRTKRNDGIAICGQVVRRNAGNAKKNGQQWKICSKTNRESKRQRERER